MKKIIPLLIILIVSLSSCLYPYKINKWVAKKYPDAQYKSLKPKPVNVTITSPLVTKDQKISTTKQQVKNFLPLIVWWQYDCINTCKLNPNVPVNMFGAALQTYARSKAMESKFNGQTLQLSINSLPGGFQLIDKSRMIFPLVFWNRITWQPYDSTVSVSWTLTGPQTQARAGTVSLISTYRGMPIRRTRSFRKITWMYLDGYEADLKNLAKQVVEEIVAEESPAIVTAQ